MPSDGPLADAVKRRLVRFGDRFTSDELEHGDVELEAVPENPDPPPEDERAEPWALAADAPPEKHRKFGHRIREYREKHRHGD